MAIVYEDNLKRNISSAKSVPVYILFGEDGYLKKNYTDKISERIADSDDVFNYQRFEDDCDLQEVYDSVSQLPVMSDKKCVILIDYDFEHCSKQDLEKLYALTADTNDTSVLIILFDNIEIDYKKSAKFKKLDPCAEKGGGMAVLLNHRREAELVKMLTDGAAKRGCRFETSAARYLVETAGNDINILKNELDKLCNYIPNGNISKSTVDLVCIKTVEASVYNLSKQIIDCNIEVSLKTLDELFFMRIEPVIILYTISSTYVDMYRIYSGQKSGKSISVIAETFGYKGREFVLDRANRDLKRFNFKKLALSLEALLQADKLIKSFGNDARIVLEQLIVRLVYIIVKGEAVD